MNRDLWKRMYQKTQQKGQCLHIKGNDTQTHQQHGPDFQQYKDEISQEITTEATGDNGIHPQQQ